MSARKMLKEFAGFRGAGGHMQRFWLPKAQCTSCFLTVPQGYSCAQPGVLCLRTMQVRICFEESLRLRSCGVLLMPQSLLYF